MAHGRETAIALAVTFVSVAAMAIDHLIGTESEPGESESAEPLVFVGTSVLAVALIAALFRFAVTPVSRDPDSAGKRSILFGVVAVVTLPLLFLAIPFPFAGAAVALGLIGRDGRRRRFAVAAVVMGVLVVALGIGAYLYELL